jgi:hypothetical protein
VLITTDGFPGYTGAIDAVFQKHAAHAILKKIIVKGIVRGVEKQVVSGDPNPRFVTTSLVERNNLTLRTFVRRLVRKTLSYTKKLEHLDAAATLHFTHYNYCWHHRTLKTTPAVAAGIAGEKWTFKQLYEYLRDRWPDEFMVAAEEKV